MTGKPDVNQLTDPDYARKELVSILNHWLRRESEVLGVEPREDMPVSILCPAYPEPLLIQTWIDLLENK